MNGTPEKAIVNVYDLQLDKLNIVDLNEQGVLAWIAEVVSNRGISEENAAIVGEHLMELYKPDTTQADIIKGYRADDSYTQVIEAFLLNQINLYEVERLFYKGSLGNQIFLKSEKAFEEIRWIESYTATLTKEDKTTYYEIVRTKVSENKPNFGSYRDISGEYENAIEAILNYMPGKTETLFLTEETTEKGDFIGAVVKASGLTGGSRAYADANSSHWAYEQFKTAREYGLVNGLRIQAYDDLTYRDAYFALYNAIKGKGITVNESEDLLSGMELVGWKDGEKAMLSALISVNVITKEELASVKAIDSVKRGKAADFVYKLANVKNAEIVPVKPESKSNLGLILGITVPVVCLAAGAIVFVIIRKKKLLPKA